MIEKLTPWRFVGRVGQLRAPATAAPCNDNHQPNQVRPDRRRMRRQVLVRHWQVQPQTSVLECVWQTLDLTAADDDSAPLGGQQARFSFGVNAAGAVA